MLGANGAGKTTLMRPAPGLVPVAAGGVAVLGRPATRGNSQIGYVPQNRGAIAGLRLTCWDIVASAAIGGRFGLVRLDKATRRESDWAHGEDGRGSGGGGRARFPPALDQRIVRRRAPAGAVEPGSHRQAAPAAARRAVD